MTAVDYDPATGEVLITTDVKTAAILATTIDWFASPQAGPYRMALAGQKLQPLLDALYATFGRP